MLFNIILIIGIIAAVLVIFIVLIQNPKGGGLASNFSSSTQIFGAQRTSEGVEKLTWIFATIILLVSLAASSYNGVSSSAGQQQGTKDEKFDERVNAPIPKGKVTPPAPANQTPPPAGGQTPAPGQAPSPNQ